MTTATPEPVPEPVPAPPPDAAVGRVEVAFAVIGLGPMGAGALRRLAAAGVSCLGIGQAEPAELATHDGVFSSHYDSGRVTRHVDARFEWAELARRSIADYAEIARLGGTEFHHPSGVVYATTDADTANAIAAVSARLAAAGIAVERVPQLDDARVHLAPGAAVFVEGPPAGHVDPRRMIAAQLAASQRSGATVRRTVATSIARRAAGWEITCADGVAVHADTVIVAGGPHTDELGGLPQRPVLDVRGETVITAVLDHDEQARLAGLPSVLAPVEHPVFADVYVVPPTAYPDGTVRLKLGATRHRPVRLDDRSARARWMRGDAHRAELDDLRTLTLGVFPGLRAVRWETKPCLLTDTPSDLPYVDHLAAGLVIAAGCNGYAAKSGDAIGALAADLARHGRWTDDVLDPTSFRLCVAGTAER